MWKLLSAELAALGVCYRLVFERVVLKKWCTVSFAFVPFHRLIARMTAYYCDSVMLGLGKACCPRFIGERDNYGSYHGCK